MNHLPFVLINLDWLAYSLLIIGYIKIKNPQKIDGFLFILAANLTFIGWGIYLSHIGTIVANVLLSIGIFFIIKDLKIGRG